MGELGRRWTILIGSILAAVALSGEVEGRPLVVAHRGGALLRPENTLPAFDLARQLGADILEFDMQMTRDGQVVISHDTRVNPAFCTAGARSGVVPGPVRELTLAQLRKFDCGSRHRAIYPTQRPVPGARMPTLDGVLARYKSAGVQFFGEIKMPAAGDGSVDPVEFARLVEAKVRRHGLVDRFILQSFDWRAIDAMHAINPRIRTCLLGVRRATVDYLTLVRQHHAGCLVLRRRDTDRAQIHALKSAGVLVFSDVVDDPVEWRDYIADGFDAIFTNDPRGALAAVRDAAAGK